ncbi:hypothetical protein RUM43_000272 [Polyplax serrata]|uniref:Uncharacterized protein n=1 Tax=Polyplax serrata TaxID=468196 RepID=A0AAN8XS05_POLSC
MTYGFRKNQKPSPKTMKKKSNKWHVTSVQLKAANWQVTGEKNEIKKQNPLISPRCEEISSLGWEKDGEAEAEAHYLGKIVKVFQERLEAGKLEKKHGDEEEPRELQDGGNQKKLFELSEDTSMSGTKATPPKLINFLSLSIYFTISEV